MVWLLLPLLCFGGETDFPLNPPHGAAQVIITGPDGNLWFPEPSADIIGRITPQGTIVGFPLAKGSNPKDITVGPDGNLWFTESGMSKIGRITSAGAVTEFAIPSGGHPGGITTGPDGNLWFTLDVTANGGNDVGNITPGGQNIVTEFNTANALAGTLAGPIRARSDGNLWYSHSTGSTVFDNFSIVRITPAGVATTFTGGPGQAISMAVASDSTLFVGSTEESNCAHLCADIAKVDINGVYTHLRTFFNSPNVIGEITFAGDGALWFPTRPDPFDPTAPVVLMRYVPAGDLATRYLNATASVVGSGLVFGPDGALWFSARLPDSSPAIARVDFLASTLNITPSPLIEGQTASLTGSLADFTAATTHHIVIDWGDGSPNLAQDLSGSGIINYGPFQHVMPDLNPNIVTLTAGTTNPLVVHQAVTVTNVPPKLSNVPLNLTDQAGVVTLTGNITDPGAEDTFTLSITWGDGSPTQKKSLAAGSTSFSVAHAYAKTGQFNIATVVTDDFFGTDNAASLATVNSAAPAPSFSGPQTMTIQAGETANFNLILAASSAPGTYTLTCLNAPPHATCSVQPPSLTLNNAQSGSVMVSVQTTAGATAAPGSRPIPIPRVPGVMVLTVLASMMLAWAIRRGRTRVPALRAMPLILLVAVALLVTAVGCGGGSSSSGGGGTPKGTYTINVNATSGSTTVSTNLSVTVN